MTTRIENTAAEILAFITVWNENLRAELAGQEAMSQTDLFRQHPRLLDTNIRPSAFANWERNRDRASSEVLGFLLQHRVSAEAEAAPLSNVDRLRLCDELSGRFSGTSYWSLAHDL